MVQLSQSLRNIDEHLGFIIHNVGPEGANAILSIYLRLDGGTPPPLASPRRLQESTRSVEASVPPSRFSSPSLNTVIKPASAKWQGAVLLQIAVDENGVPQDIRVIRPLGMGLDQKAIEAVQKWRFKPGLKDGNPVPTAAVIEVNFRLAQSPETIAAAAASRPVMVGGGVMDKRVVQRVPPVYPSTARTARVQGTVQVSIIIGPDGRVQDVQSLVRSRAAHPGSGGGRKAMGVPTFLVERPASQCADDRQRELRA